MAFNQNDPAVLFMYLFTRTDCEFTNFSRKRGPGGVQVFTMNYGQCRLKRRYNQLMNHYSWSAISPGVESPITDQLAAGMLEKQFYQQNPYGIEGPDQTRRGVFRKRKHDHSDFGAGR